MTEINNIEFDYLEIKSLLYKGLSLPKIRKTSTKTISIDELEIADKYKKRINIFLDKTKGNFEFSNAGRILKTLTIETISHKIAKKAEIDGGYNIKRNLILLDEKEINAIYHELFHVFTSWNKGLTIGSGFNKIGLGYNIGNSLDEGYTDLLSHDYFNSEISYMLEANIANKLELMLDKSNMRKMYETNNRSALLSYLENNSNKILAYKFILLYDKLCDYDSDDKKAIDIMSTLSNYLVDVYINDLVTQYEVGILSYADIYNKLDKFKDKFVKHAFDDKKLKKEYLRSSDYLNITSKLSNGNFQKQLAIRKTCY